MRSFVTMIFLLFLLLFFHNDTIHGAQQGLLLWYQTLIPSLLPFILITNALSETNAYQTAAKHLQKYIKGDIYDIVSIFLGNLCGYPLGGKIVNDFVHNHCITPQRANDILSLTGQASPMFLIGYVYIHILDKQLPLFLFLGSIYIPVLILTIVKFRFITKQSSNVSLHITSAKLHITETFMQTTQTLVIIGMYVILFSIVIKITLPLSRFSFFILPLSALEITTGLDLFASSSKLSNLYIPFLCALSSFGGLCSAFQIKGVLTYPNASIKKYLLDKCILSTGTFFIIYGYLAYSSHFHI